MWRDRTGAVLMATLIAAIVIAVVVLTLRSGGSPGLLIERREPIAGIDELRIDVSGAVLTPAVVTAPPGARVADAIALAGGLADDADRAALNLARRVTDEEVIRVPRLGEATALLDLNHATAEALEALPGIGPGYAARILAAREEHPFASTDDLIDRELIPARTYLQIRDLVTVTTP